MGYQRPLLKLVFEDPEMSGLEVLCKRPNIYMIEEYTKTDRNLDLQLELLVQCVISWNLEDEEGTPVPITVKGLKLQDQPLLVGLLDAWMSQAVKVTGPLGSSSLSGEPSPEVSIPMEPLSVSLPS